MSAIRTGKTCTKKVDGSFQVAWNSTGPEEFKAILAGIKAIPGRQYNPDTRTWLVPPSGAKALKDLGFPIPDEVVASAAPTSWEDIELDPTRVHPDIFPVQRPWLQILEANGGRAINADDPGAGKTIMALAALGYFDDYPALIVVPAPLKLQWARQFGKWCRGKACQILSGRTPDRHIRPITTIINWEILPDWAGHFEEDSRGYTRFAFDGPLAEIPWKTLVLDEFHKHIGKSSSDRTKCIRAIAKKIPHIQPLSGTPIRTRPAQFYPILNMVAPAEFSAEMPFKQRYCNPTYTPFGVKYDGASNMEELHERIRPIMLRRTITQLQPDLPPYLPLVVPMPVNRPSNPVVDISRSPFDLKRDSIAEWLREFMEYDASILVFAWHRAAVDWLCSELADLNPVKIYGGQTPADREAQKQKFLTRASRLMIANIEAAGTGIDGLQAVCRDVVFAEFPASPTEVEQAYRRLYRTGQKSCVSGYYLIADGVQYDEDRAAILDERAATMRTLIDGQEMPDEDFVTTLIKKSKPRSI